MQSAYMAGRWKAQMENADDRPYLMYVAVLDSRTRPAHKALHGKIFHMDDPFWDSFYPPNGWKCRCRTRALTEKEAIQRYGRKPAPSGDRLSETDALVSKSTGEMRPVAVYKDTLTGMKISPDPGFSCNPGKAAFEPFTPRPFDPSELEGGYKTVGAQFHKKTPIEDMPAKKLTKDMLLEPHQKSGWSEEDYINAFLKEFNAEKGKPAVHRDVINDPVVISEDLFKDRVKGGYKVLKAGREVYLPMLADTIKDPAEIWLTWVQTGGKIRLCKRYIGIYAGGEGKEGGFVVFDLLKDMWRGTTAFSPDRMISYLDKQRAGTLLYAKY